MNDALYFKRHYFEAGKTDILTLVTHNLSIQSLLCVLCSELLFSFGSA
jgi:hypothetical protein